MKKPLAIATAFVVSAGLALGLGACSGAGTQADANAAGSTEITVGTEGTYRPFSFHDTSSHELTGYDIEVTKAVGAKLGMKVNFAETQWDGMFAALDAKRIDVVANEVSITPEREKKYSFSTAYTVSPGLVVTRADDSSIGSVADLSGKKTAVSANSNWFAIAKDAGADIEAVEGWAQSVALLQQKRVDATVNDRLTVLDFEQNNPNVKLRIGATTEETITNGFMFRKDSPLVEKFDSALKELTADGTIAKISQKYFGQDVSK